MSERLSAWPTTDVVRSTLGASDRLAFDRWLAAHDQKVKAALVTPEARAHWDWTQKQRIRSNIEGCVCTTCGIMARIESEARP